MTKEMYDKYNPDSYVGKHEKKTYTVWRAIGPARPAETFVVEGLDKVRELVDGCYSWDVTDIDGNPVQTRTIFNGG